MPKLIYAILSFLFISLCIPAGVFGQSPALIVPTGFNNSSVINTLISPDGNLMYTLTLNGNVKCFDIKSGLELRSYGGGDIATDIILSPNGKTLVIIGKNYGIYDAQTAKKLAEVTYSLGSFNSCFLDNENFYTAPYGGGFLVFNKGNWNKPFTVKDRTPKRIWLENIAVAPGGKYLAAIYTIGKVKKLGTWKLSAAPDWKSILLGNTPAQQSFTVQPDGYFGGSSGYLSFSEDGKTLLNAMGAVTASLGQPHYSAMLVNMATGKSTPVLNTGEARALEVTNDGKLLMAVKEAVELRKFGSEQAEWKQNDFFYTSNTGTTYTNTAIKGGLFYASLKSGEMGLAAIADGTIQKKLGAGGAQGQAMVLSADRRWLAISRADCTVALWDLKYGRMVNTLGTAEPKDKIINMAISAHGERLLIHKKGEYLASYGTVEIADTKTGTSLVKKYTVNEEESIVCDISPAGDYFYYHPDQKSLCIYSIAEQKITHTQPVFLISNTKLSADGRYIFYYDNNYQDRTKAGFYRLEIESRELKKIGDNNTFYGNISPSTTGNMLAIGGQPAIKIIGEAGTILKTGGFVADPYSDMVALSATGAKLAAGDTRSGAIRVFDVGTDALTMNVANAHAQKITALAFLSEDLLISTSADTHTKLWSATGKLKGEFYVLGDNEWIFSTPDGRFDGSANAMKRLYYVQGNQPIPLDNLYEKFYAPGLLAKVVNGGEVPAPEVNVNTLAPAPKVKMTFDVARNLEVVNDVAKINWANESISVTVKADCTENSIDEIRLYLNGKLVNSATRNLTVVDDKNDKTLTRTFALKLTPGNNSFKAIAFNKQRTESRPDETDVIYTPAASAPAATTANDVTLHLMVIGINNYKNPKYNLNYAKADATAFKEKMEEANSGIFSKTTVYFITDAEAMKAGIEATFNKVIAGAKPRDIFIFYYAGHGVMSSEGQKDFYIVPYDVTQLYGAEDALAQKGISSRELQEFSRKIPAQKQLYILDACQSAGALEALGSRGAAEEKAIAQLARSTGTHWLTASGSEQFATEFTQLGHGVFTYALLQGLLGAAANGDKQVTINELKAYLEVQVPELSQKYKGTAQYPASYGFGNDFPLMIIK